MHRIDLIEDSAFHLIEPKRLKILVKSGLVTVSGRPLVRMGDTERYYNDNVMESNVPLEWQRVTVRELSGVGHNHLEPVFLGRYAVLTGIDARDGTDYEFGIRQELAFDLRPPDTVASVTCAAALRAL